MKRPFVLSLAALVVLAVLPVAPATAAFPGRNARIVFMRSGGGLGEIQSMTATGGGLLNLTNTPLIADRDPAWSPDGKRIAYVHLDDDEVWGNIYTITPDGKDNTQLTFGTATDETPDWGVA